MPATQNTAATVNATLNKNARRVLAAIAKHSGAQHCGTIAQDMSVKIDTVKKHANALAAAGLIEIRCSGPRVASDAIEGTIYQIGNGEATWSAPQIPSAAWSRDGETNRKPSRNTYYLSVNQTGRDTLA